jgi:hypothetical protein
MSEIVLYFDQWASAASRSTALGAAMQKLGYKVFAESSATAIHHGLDPDVVDWDVTGLSGTYRPGTPAKNSWTIRWDGDDQIGIHVNLSMKTAQGTEKYAFLEMRRDELDASTPAQAKQTGMHMYLLTLDRLRPDCGWSKKQHDDLPLTRRKKYKEDCAKAGHSSWTARICGTRQTIE